MPPPRPAALHFTAEELEAVILGLSRVRQMEEADLHDAAGAALERIAAAWPPPGTEDTPETRARQGDGPALATIRRALREETKLRLRYTDRKAKASERVVWPVALEEGDGVLAAWCESREDFRHFRLDRMQAVEGLPDRLPRRRWLLRAEWQAQMEDQGLW